MSFVYIIKNIINDKVYIGKTSLESIQARFQEHLKASCKKSLQQRRVLYAAMAKYGKENFYIEELEKDLTDEQACEMEAYYINKYQSYIGFDNCKGYNMTLGGDGQHWADYQLIVDTYLKNNRNETKTAKELQCTKRTIRRACAELNIPVKKNSKTVEMYDISSKTLLRSFGTVKEAKEYISSISDSKGSALDRKDSLIIYNFLFKVIRN